MANDDMAWAYDKRTGEKLPRKVPVSHFDIFPDVLSPTPLEKEKTRSQGVPRVPEKPARRTEGESNEVTR